MIYTLKQLILVSPNFRCTWFSTPFCLTEVIHKGHLHRKYHTTGWTLPRSGGPRHSSGYNWTGPGGPTKYCTYDESTKTTPCPCTKPLIRVISWTWEWLTTLFRPNDYVTHLLNHEFKWCPNDIPITNNQLQLMS